MIRRTERTMIQKKEHRGTALTKLLILFDDAGNEGQDDTTIRQHSKKHQRGFLPNIFTQFCSYRGGLDIGGQSECHPGTKFMSFSSISYQNGSPRGLSKHTPHIIRKTKHQKTEFLSKSGICREWPHVVSCGLALEGAHPNIVYKPKRNPYNPGRGRKHRDNKKVNYFSRSKCFWSGDLAARKSPRQTSTQRGAPRLPERGAPGLARRHMSQSIHGKHPRGTSCGVSTGDKGTQCVSTTDDATKTNSTKTLLKCMMNAYTLSCVLNLRQKVQTKGTTERNVESNRTAKSIWDNEYKKNISKKYTPAESISDNATSCGYDYNLSVQEYKAMYENKTIVKSIEDFRGPTARLITDGERAIALAQTKLALFTSEKKRSLLGSKHNILLMLNMYTLSHVMRCKVFVFGRVKTSNVIKEQHMQPNRQTKSKVNRTIKNTPIVDFTECNKECTYYYNVAKYNSWGKHIWTQFFWKKYLQRKANDRLQQQPFGFYFDEDIIDLDLLIHDLQYILRGDIITGPTLEPFGFYFDEDNIDVNSRFTIHTMWRHHYA